MGYSEEIVHEVIRKYGPCTQPLLRSEETEEENQRLQGHRSCAPCSVCPDATQSRSVGVRGSTNNLTGDSTPKNTRSHTEESVEEKISLLSLIDSKPYTSKGRVNCFRRGPAGQKHVIWGRNEKDNGNVNLKSNGLSQSLSSSSHEEVSIILRGATGHQRGPAFPKNDFLHQADPLFPNNVKAACKKPSDFYSSLQPKPRYSQNSPLLPLPQLLPSDTNTVLAGASDHTDSVVTGVQRFRDMLKISYKLELKNEPGRSDLKHIVIDGCNVAFTHGLHEFFSCRGIAIAVEYFWKLGHRNITVFVPQWRTRRHPNAREQHFLTQLKELGILSLSPSRMFLGKRIDASHINSFLLHLAHKTGGVIVSNNKFRGFVTESASWKEIIAKRLLQYTFVEDIFLVPDNPLGRNGPRLKEFLRKEGSGDLEPLLGAVPNVDTFAQSHNTQAANTSYQPPYWNQGTSSGPWLPQQPHFTSDTHAGFTGASDHTDSVVKDVQRFRDMGVQRFRDMLKVSYTLELKNEPGRADLKHIVIDGCNVAFTHGLHKFFSCRGIAIAVEYFWKLGHRNITVFVPQWRTRLQANAREQHFLTQLKELGILSLTPSIRFLGKRSAASHHDSFLLHLAHKTGGVIVSNDNFREFVTESVSWREIIAKRLLQYTFVGDIFMVPDNPLGRNGPRLKEFLRKEGSGDLEPLLRALSNVDTFAQSHNTQVAITSYQPPYWNQRTSSGPWLPQQPHFTSLASTSGIEQNHLMPAQRSSAETSELREAMLKIFPDSEQKQKIEEILAAQPFLKDLNVLSGLILDLSLG